MKFFLLLILSSFHFIMAEPLLQKIVSNPRFTITPNEIEIANEFNQFKKNLYKLGYQSKDIDALLFKMNTSLYTEEYKWLKEIKAIYNFSNFKQIKIYCAKEHIAYSVKSFNRSIEIYCRKMIARLIQNKVHKKKKINTAESNWINKNFKYFINGTNDRNLTTLLKTAKRKQRESFNRIRANAHQYLKKNDKKPSKSFAKLISWKFKKTKKRSASKKTIHQQAVSKIRASFSYPDRKYTNQQIRKEINSIVSFIKKNINKLDSKIISEKLINTALFYSRRKHYDQSRQLNKLALSLDSKSKNKAHFGNIWSYIYPGKFKLAYDYIKLHQLDNEFKNNSSSQLMFWTAYVLEKNSKKNKANSFYNQTMKRHPMSYYAVLASKFFKQNNPQSKDLKINPFKPAYEFFEFLFNEKQIDNKLALTIKKLKIWSMASNYESVHRELDVLDSISPISYNSTKMSLKILTAKILGDSGYDLKAFQMLYKPIDNEDIGFNNLVLPILYPKKHISILKGITQKKKFDYLVLLSLIRQESAFNPRAMSGVGARGLMQLMPKTARGIKKKVTRDELFIPEINLEIGAEYFEKVYNKYNGNLVYALASYNAGPHRVDEWRTTSFHSNKMIYNIENIPFLETRKYVKLIYRNLFFYKLMLSSDLIIDPTTPNKVFDVAWNYKK